MAIFGFVFGLVALLLIGVGIVVGLIACALTAILLALGIVSSSVFVGMRTGKAGAGFRAFLIQIGILCGIPAGALCAWLAKSFFASYGGDISILLYGALGGAFAGVMIALMLDFISRRLGTWAGARIESETKRWQAMGSSKKPIEVMAEKVE
jgi:hypothetical protein